MDYPKDYKRTDDDVLMYRCDNNEAAYKLSTIIQNRPKSIVVELNTYRKYVPQLIKALIDATMVMNASVKQSERYANPKAEKDHKRWTENEDKMLIDMVCYKDCSMMEIATTFGRTVSAIQTRLTYLVGVKRLSQQIAGKFIGKINGEQTEADLVGTVYKE